MAKTKREMYDAERITIKHLAGIEINPDREERGRPTDALSEDEAETILHFLDAKDPQTTVPDHTGDSTKSDGTLSRYANLLKRTAEIAHFDLTEADVDQINKLMDDLRSGAAPKVKDDGLSTGTVKNFQSTLRKYYEWLDNGVDKDEIVIQYPENQSVDERDILTKEEIHALRAHVEHPRDKALIDMLIYTGQRISALLGLRLRDVQPDEGNSGVFYLNEDSGDLKGASGKRPLLYAQKAAREWKQQHPCKDDPNAFFFTTKRGYVDRDDIVVGNRLEHSTVYTLLQRIGKKADVPTRKLNAHNFRHTFVTICKREYDMDNDTIKRLLGHGEGSTIMEDTYTHLTDEDVIADAERDMDLRDDEPESSLTPGRCDVCGEPVEKDDAKACSNCGQIFTPDAMAVQEEVTGEVREDKEGADELQEYSDLDKLEQMVNDNPELLDILEDLAGD